MAVWRQCRTFPAACPMAIAGAEALADVEDVIAAWLHYARKHGDAIPEPERKAA